MFNSSQLFSTFSTILNYSQLFQLSQLSQFRGWVQTFADEEGTYLTLTNFRMPVGFLMGVEKVEKVEKS